MTISKERMVSLAQLQLEAYNKKDIESFCSCYHEEVEAYSLNSNELLFKGIEKFRERYQKRFTENPNMHCEIRKRTVLSDSVLDEEWVTGLTGNPTPSHLVAVYHFRDNLIHRVFFTR